MKTLIRILVVILLIALLKASHEQEYEPNGNDNTTREGTYDSMLSRFDKDSNGKLSVEEVVSAMADNARQGGMDFGPGYYNIIRRIMSEFIDANNEIDRDGAKRMEKNLSDGLYN